MVEWKELVEVCKIERGVRVIKKDLQEDGDIPVFQNSLTPLGYYSSSNYPANTPFVISAGAAGEIGFCSIPFWAADDCLCLSSFLDLSSKYVYYYLLVKQPLLKSRVRKASVPRLSRTEVEKIKIPIPSLSEQTRIVGILDTFTSSIENLKERIALRRKQYEHYRDQLLDLEGKEGVEMKFCSEICEVTDYVANGSFASLRENVNYKQEPDYAILVRTTDLSNNFEGEKVYIDEKAYNFLSKSSLVGGEIIINNIGAGVGQTFKCPKLNKKMSLGPNSIMVKTSNNDFYYYWFNSIYGQNAIMKVVTPGAMPKFNKTGFKTILAPVPSPQEQSRIVSILDTFEASLSNLEAQLKEREKQYEYYRNKLLTFE